MWFIFLLDNTKFSKSLNLKLFLRKMPFDYVIVACWKTWVVRCGVLKYRLTILSFMLHRFYSTANLFATGVDLLPSKRAVVECSYSLTITASFDEHRIDIGQPISIYLMPNIGRQNGCEVFFFTVHITATLMSRCVWYSRQIYHHLISDDK